MWDTDYFSEGSLYEMSQSQSEGTTSDQVLNQHLRGVVAKKYAIWESSWRGKGVG